MKQHPTAVVSPKAEIADDVEIGPFCLIHDDVKIGPANVFQSHVVVHSGVNIGSGNVFHQACSIGDDPQDISFRGEKSRVEIGDNNVFREFFTVHKGTAKDRMLTIIGNNGYFMASSHVAHDCTVGNNVVFVNTASLGGHTIAGDHCYIGPFCGVHQNCVVGEYCFIGGPTIVNQDVVPYSLVVADQGNRSKTYGPNLVGLRRKGFSNEVILEIKRAFKLLFNSGLNTSQAVERIRNELQQIPEILRILEFISKSKRGIVK